MRLDIKPGKYVLAVSGGIDSMALLDLMAKRPGYELIVAHFNHGTRPQTDDDEALVKATAKGLGLPFEAGYGHLGEQASEEQARNARHKFLKEVSKKYKANGIITAHHQDDMIETALLNILRGTGRQGIIAISSNPAIIRPLLNVPKKEIEQYAKENKLTWLEDSTNQDTEYLRNYLRKEVLPALTIIQRKNILSKIDIVANNEVEIRELIATMSHSISRNNTINRRLFSLLPSEVGNELLVNWLRQANLRDFDKATINRLNLAIKTAKAGTTYPVKGGLVLKIGRESAEFRFV